MFAVRRRAAKVAGTPKERKKRVLLIDLTNFFSDPDKERVDRTDTYNSVSGVNSMFIHS